MVLRGEYDNSRSSDHDPLADLLTTPDIDTDKGPRRIGRRLCAGVVATILAYNAASDVIRDSSSPEAARAPSNRASVSPTLAPSEDEFWGVVSVTTVAPSEVSEEPELEIKQPAPKPKPKPLELDVGTWNTYKGVKRDIGKIVVDKLMKHQDIVGLQETKPNFKYLQAIACDDCQYGLYPSPEEAEENTELKRNAVVWSKEDVEHISVRYVQTASKHIKKNKGDLYRDVTGRFYTVHLFKQKTSGQKFYFINTHLPAYVAGKDGKFRKKPNAKSARAIAAYKNHMRLLGRDVEQLQKENLPIVVVGDFNISDRGDQKDPSMPNNALGELGFENTFRITNYDGIDENDGTHGGGSRLIDYVYVWSGDRLVQIQSNEILDDGSKSGWGGSDHKPVSVSGQIA